MTVTGRKSLSASRGKFRSLSRNIGEQNFVGEQNFAGTGSIGIPLLKELIETRKTILIPLLQNMKENFLRVKIVSSLGDNCFHIEFYTSEGTAHKAIVRGCEMVSWQGE